MKWYEVNREDFESKIVQEAGLKAGDPVPELKMYRVRRDVASKIAERLEPGHVYYEGQPADLVEREFKREVKRLTSWRYYKLSNTGKMYSTVHGGHDKIGIVML